MYLDTYYNFNNKNNNLTITKYIYLKHNIIITLQTI